MPIEQLLALYNCVTPAQPTFTSSGPSKRRSKTSRNAGLDKSLMPPPETPNTPTDQTSSETIREETSENAATAETACTETNAEKDTQSHTDNEIEANANVTNDQQIKVEETTTAAATTTDETTAVTTTTTTTTTSSKEIKEEPSENVDVKQETNETDTNDKETNSKVDIKPDPEPSDNTQSNGQNTEDDTDTPHVKGLLIQLKNLFLTLIQFEQQEITKNLFSIFHSN